MAIKADALMIGNYILSDDNQVVKVECIESKEFNDYDGGGDFPIKYSDQHGNMLIGELDKLQGIPLSESVLLKCGIEYDSMDDRYKFDVGVCQYVIEQQDDWYFIGVNHGTGIFYFVWNICHLHTLQNICSLLGKHLTFKP